MERIKTNKALHGLILILLSTFFYCCADEHDRFDVPVDGKEKLVTFSVKVPGNSTPKTYALTDDDENEVKQIAVLLFKGEKYIYQPIYSNTIANGADNKTKTFTLKVPEGTYDMVILANANASLADIVNNITAGTDDKSTVLSKLVLANDGKWNTKSSSDNYKPIPMWAEKQNVTVASNMGTVDAALLRMVSKIDVNLLTEAQKNFDMTSIRLYYYNSEGQIVPNADTWDNAKKEVSKPSVFGTLTKGPLLYEEEIKKNSKSKGFSCANEIYTFEAAAGTANDLTKNTCLIIGGKYNNDTKETYYRVDFANTDNGVTTYLALLRNFQYKVNVKSISGSGFSTPDEALNSHPVNIKAGIIKWSDGKYTDFTINDQYFIAVSQSEFTFTKEARGAQSPDNKLYIFTDYPKGFTMEIADINGNTTNAKWLSCSSTSGASDKDNEIRLNLEENKTDSSRTAYIHIHIKAERLEHIIKVTQLNTTKMGVFITQDGSEIERVEFVSTKSEVEKGTPPAAQMLSISWSPTSAKLRCNNRALGDGIEFKTGTSTQKLPGTGDDFTSNGLPFAIQPTALPKNKLADDPFYKRTSIYLYTVSDGAYSITKTLEVSQFVYDLVADIKSSYLLNGGSYTFYVRSNTEWTIKSVTPSSNELLNLQSTDNLRVNFGGGPDTNLGTPITFHVTNDETGNISGTVSIVFKSTLNKFGDITITLNLASGYYPEHHKGWAGSNIYWDSEKGQLAFDDVTVTTHQEAQGLLFRWGSLTAISPTGNSIISYYLPNESPKINIKNWADIPYVTGSFNNSNQNLKNRNYLYEVTDEANGIGDICKYMTQKGLAPSGKKWRMPTANELNATIDQIKMIKGQNAQNTNSTGTSYRGGGIYRLSENNAFFPFGEYRSGNTNAIAFNDDQGWYWSGSPYGGTMAYQYYCNGRNVTSIMTHLNIDACVVRCVVE